MRTSLFWIASFVIAPTAALIACGSSDSPVTNANPQGVGTDAPGVDGNSPGPDGGGSDVVTTQEAEAEAAADAPPEAAPPVDWNKEVRFLASIEPSASGGYNFRIEPPNAEVASQTTMATGDTPQMVAVVPSMKFAYVPLGTTNGVDGFQVYPDTLKRMNDDPFTVVGNDARFACAHPSSNFLYVTNFGDSTVSALKIDGKGLLTAAGAAAQALAGPLPCVVDPTGTVLFVASRTASQVSAFAIGADGTLSGRQDFAVAADPVALALHPKLKVLYVASATGKAVSAFTYAANGALTANGSVAPGKAAAPMPMGLAVTPSGAWLYSSNNADTVVNIWAVNATTGALTAAGSAEIVTGGRAVTADPGGAWLFVHTDNSVITVFDVNAATGALTAHPTTLGAGATPWADAIFHTGLKVP
jgi:6-phosphogluconolactonase (cycloisomerase 2 family)